MARAEDNPVEDDQRTERAEKKRKSSLLIILSIAVVLLLIGVGVLLFLLMGNQDGNQQQALMVSATESSLDNALARQEQESAESDALPIYVELGKFQSNLRPEQDDFDASGIVVIELSLKVKDQEAEADVKARVPEIRDRVLRLLNTRSVSQLDHPEEKSRLSDDILIEANRVINPELAGIIELRVRSQAGGRSQVKTGHDVQTDTSGVHENAISHTAAAVAGSIQDDTGITRKLPVQRVLFTSFIVQRL